MSKDDPKNLRRSAYLDQELSVDELIAFESTLSKEERAELHAEMNFDAALAERLEQSKGCPDELWGRLKSQIQTQSTMKMQRLQRPDDDEDEDEPVSTASSLSRAAGASPSLRTWRLLRFPLSYAAVALLAVLLTLLATSSPADAPSSTPVIFSDNLEAFAMDSTVGGDFNKVSRELVIHGFNVNLTPPDGAQTHDIQLLGMRTHTVGDHEVAQIYFSCCGKPVVVLLTDRANEESLKTFSYRGLPGRWHAEHQAVDNYVIHAVSSHPLNDITDLFS